VHVLEDQSKVFIKLVIGTWRCGGCPNFIWK